MARTFSTKPLIYDSPVWRPVLKALSWLYLKVTGWRVVGDIPAMDKLVIVGGPHTSNWDFLTLMSMIGAKHMSVNYLAKHTLFEGMFGWFFAYTGGIPVNRSSAGAGDIVDQVVEQFKMRDHIWLGVSPEGTRKPVEKWKTGFHRIALAAKVPVAAIFIDAKTKTMGFGPVFELTGDVETDMDLIKQFFKGYTGIKPANFAS